MNQSVVIDLWWEGCWSVRGSLLSLLSLLRKLKVIQKFILDLTLLQLTTRETAKSGSMIIILAFLQTFSLNSELWWIKCICVRSIVNIPAETASQRVFSGTRLVKAVLHNTSHYSLSCRAGWWKKTGVLPDPNLKELCWKFCKQEE